MKKAGPRLTRPNEVVRFVREQKAAGLCPACDHGYHRDGPCDLCGDRCRYPKSMDAAQERFHEALTDLGKTLRDALPKWLRARQ